jgi:hypothetical protein
MSIDVYFEVVLDHQLFIEGKMIPLLLNISLAYMPDRTN